MSDARPVLFTVHRDFLTDLHNDLSTLVGVYQEILSMLDPELRDEFDLEALTEHVVSHRDLVTEAWADMRRLHRLMYPPHETSKP